MTLLSLIKGKKNTQINRGENLLELVLWILILGVITIFLYSLSFTFLEESSSVSKGIEICSINLSIAGASLAAGGLLGFLFGNPRSESISKENNNNVNQEGNETSSKFISENYGDNDSLEQISEWLTKILLGAGLAQISSLSKLMSNFATYLQSIANSSTLGVFGVSVAIIYIVCGFIGSYLWARFTIRTELTRRDIKIEQMDERFQQVDNKVNKVNKLILGISFNPYEYITLKKIYEQDLNPDYPLNEKAKKLLWKLLTKGLIEEKTKDLKNESLFKDTRINLDNSEPELVQIEKNINLRDYFIITQEGIDYLNQIKETEEDEYFNNFLNQYSFILASEEEILKQDLEKMKD